MVESAYEKAADAFELDTVAEPGREVGEEVCSRDADMLLDSRRNHDWGCVSGVPVCGLLPFSRCIGLSMPPTLKLARGVSTRFWPTLALAERDFPSDAS